MLSRVRDWRDLFPSLAIVDALRPVSTIAVLILVSIAIAASFGLEKLFESDQEISSNGGLAVYLNDGNTAAEWSGPVGQPRFSSLPADATEWLLAPLAVCFDAVRLLIHPSLSLMAGERWDMKISVVFLLVSHQFLILCIWAIPAGYVMRQSGLAMGGRMLLSTIETLRLIASRFLGFLGVAFIPILIVSAVVGYHVFVAFANRIPVVGAFVGTVLDIAGIPLSLIGGLLGFSAFLAVPLGWAAVSLERDGSSFDGISRGYEYTLRRPVQWFCYGSMATVVTYILVALAQGVTHLTAILISSTAALFDAPPTSGRTSLAIIQSVPLVVALSIMCSLVAWLYLLLRQCTNHQEIEDLWEQPRPATTPLPTIDLPTDQTHS